MASLLQQRTIAGVINQYASLYGLPEHKAFLFYIIENFLSELSLNPIDIEEAIVDGGDDGGIDAVYIDEESEDYPVVYFFQSKFYTSERAFEKTFEGNAIDKIKSAIDDFVLKGNINPSYQNARLVDKLQSIKNLGIKNPRYVVVFCSNSLEPASAAKERFNEFVQYVNNNAGDEYMSVSYVHLDYISHEYLAAKQKKRVDISLQTAGRYLTQDTGDARLFVGFVDADVLVALAETQGDVLFERNVRGYLRKSNPINRDIIATGSGERSPYFVYMNNGITITCEKFDFSPIDISPLLKIRNAQIVNGQQTTRSLLQAKSFGTLKSDVKVLIRIVETTETGLLSDIIEATNSQTKVTSRDLHSNDEIQKLIEKILLTKGYFYESRKDKYRGKDGKKRVDAEVAAQAYYACVFSEPALAKDKKKWLFGEKYDEIFTLNMNPEDLLKSYLLLEEVRSLNKDQKFIDTYTFLQDATLHTAALIYSELIKKGTQGSIVKKTIEPIYKKAVKALSHLVNERSKEEGDKYEHRRTFKDPQTFGRAIEIISIHR